MFVRIGVPILWAMAALALFARDPELSAYFFPEGSSGAVANAAHAMPLLLGKVVPAGFLGLLVAGLLAAFMSTHDSYFLCWSSVLVRDVVAPLRRKPMTERDEVRLARIFIGVIGVFLLAWGVWYELPESVWTYMAVTGSMYLCGAGVCIVGGLYWRRASRAGAMAALITGLVAVSGLFVDKLHGWLGLDISVRDLTHALGLGTFALCAVVFVVVSLAVPDRVPIEEASS